MSDLIKRKKQGITEYSVLVCVLFFKVWCGFANQALLFAVGGMVSVAIDLALCVYIAVNAKRRKVTRNESVWTNNLLLAWLCFAIVYSLLFLLPRNILPPVSFLGMFTLPKQIYNILFSIIYLCPLILTVKNLNDKERKIVSNVLFAMFFAVAVGNIVVTIINPELVKNEAYNEDTSTFTLGYMSSYVLALITPMLMYKLGDKQHKTFFVLLLIFNVASVLYGGYFIAILATIISVILYFILGLKNKVLVLVLGIMLVAVSAALMFSGALGELASYLAENIKIEVLQDRLIDISEYLSGNTDVNEGDTTFRIKMYQETFNSFLRHPIFGNFVFGAYSIWDHSTILDLMSSGGLFLLALFISFIGVGYMFACQFIKDVQARRALITSITSYLFICLLNPVLSYQSLGVLFVIAPIIMGGDDPNENN